MRPLSPERPRTDAYQTGLGPLYRLYETNDGWVANACLDTSHWRALTEVVPGLDSDPRFADADARGTHADALADTIGGFLGALSAEDAFALLDRAGVPVEIAREDAVRTWFTEPDLVTAGLVAHYQHPTYGRFRQFGHLVTLSETPGRISGPPPLLGQHSRAVLTEVGYTPEEIDDLGRKGVTAWPD